MSVSQQELTALIATLGRPAPDVDGAVAAFTAAGLRPEPVCRVCHEALPAVAVDMGTHADCDPAVPGGPSPEPTLGLLSAALISHDLGSARSRQVAIGPSQLAVQCDRRLGFSLRNAPEPVTGGVPWAPLIGTAMHALIADALTATNRALGRERWLVEQRVHPDASISGSCDAYDVDTDMVIDWKVVGESTVDKARRHGPGPQYAGQLQAYGRGWQRAGHNPRWVRIVFLPRWSHVIDGAYEWTAPYSRVEAERLLARRDDIDAALTRLNVAEHPERWAELSATATSDACRFCPYHRPGGTAVAFGQCPGYQSKPTQAVNDWLAGLPPAKG